MPTRSRGNVSIDFTETINAETDLGISDGDTVNNTNLPLDNHADTLIQFEPGTYKFDDETGLDLSAGTDNVGIESTTRDRSDVTFEPATSTTEAQLINTTTDSNNAGPANFYLGHITFDRLDNWDAAFALGGKGDGQTFWFEDQVLLYDLRFVGWKGSPGLGPAIYAGGFKDGDSTAQWHVETIEDKGPVQYGDYNAENTTITIFHGSGATGNYYLSDLQIHNANESGIYAGKAPGDVTVENSYFENCRHTAVRVNGENSVVRNVCVLQDKDQMHPDNENLIGSDFDFNRGIWAQSDDAVKSLGLWEDCDVVMGNTGENDGIAAFFVNDDTGGGTIKNCRALVKDHTSNGRCDPLLISSETTSDAASPYEVSVEGSTFINRYAGSLACARIFERDGTTIDQSCFEGATDGIAFDGTQNASVTDTNINVDGTNIVTNNADVATSGITTNGTCTEPDLTSWDVGDTDSGETEETFSTDFSEYSNGVTPPDMTLRWHSVDSDWNTNQTTTTYGDARLELEAASGDRRAISWDDPGTSTTCETLIVAQFPAYTTNTSWCRSVVRGGGDSSGETGYFSTFSYSTDGSTYTFQIAEYDNGSFTTFNSVDIADVSGTQQFVRTRVENGVLMAKFWGVDETEPSTWELSETLTSPLSSGWCGVGGYPGDLQQFDYLAVGVGGASAPMPAGSAEGSGNIAIDLDGVTEPTIDATVATEITMDGDVIWAPSTIIENGLQNRWNFEDDSDTTTAVDTYGTNDGTIEGASYSSADAVIDDNALVLDGVSDRVSGMNRVIPADADFTIMGWIDLPSSPNDTYNTMLDDNGNTLYAYWDGDAAPRFWANGEGELLLGTSNLRGAGDTHLALRRDGDTFDLIVDAASEDTATYTGTLGDSATELAFGSRDDSDRHLEGPIDDFRFYNRAVPDSEITDIVNKDE